MAICIFLLISPSRRAGTLLRSHSGEKGLLEPVEGAEVGFTAAPPASCGPVRLACSHRLSIPMATPHKAPSLVVLYLSSIFLPNSPAEPRAAPSRGSRSCLLTSVLGFLNSWAVGGAGLTAVPRRGSIAGETFDTE